MSVLTAVACEEKDTLVKQATVNSLAKIGKRRLGGYFGPDKIGILFAAMIARHSTVGDLN